MKSGTPGFIGGRLLEAREARAMSGAVLADMVGVARTSITQYEKNRQTPRPEVMQRVAEALNLPLDFFMRELRPSGAGVIHYRSLSAATKAGRKIAERRHDWLRDIMLWLGQMVEMPRIEFPDLNPPTHPSFIEHEFIERAARQARRHWAMGDGPIKSVAWLLENRGSIVSLSDFGSEEIDAFSESGITSFEPHVSISANKKLAARSNFTCAHELGHLLLHRNIPEAVARRAPEHKLIEDQANEFADAFLLPMSTFIPSVSRPSLDLFRAMKAKWYVSIGAMIMRSKRLNLIDNDQFTRLWISYNRRGWRHGEPLDDVLSDARPRVLRRAFELVLGERILSKDQIRNALPYAPTDIESLCGLDPGFLSDEYSSNMIRLPPRQSAPSGIPSGGGGAALIPFNRKRDLSLIRDR